MLSAVQDSPCDFSGIAVHQQGPLTFLVKEVEDLRTKCMCVITFKFDNREIHIQILKSALFS